MTVGPNENRTGAADAAVLQPCKADVDQIDVAHSDPGSVERDALSDSGLLGCLDPVMAVLAGDQYEVPAMDESAQREALAGPFDPCMRQRGSRRGAGLVQALIVERLSDRSAITDDRCRLVAVAEFDVVQPELIGGLAEDLSGSVSSRRRVSAVLDQWPQCSPVLFCGLICR